MHADVEVERGLERLGRVEQEGVAVTDLVTDVVRQAAVGERDMVAALEHDDLGGLVETTSASGDRGSGGNATDDDEFHGEGLSIGDRADPAGAASVAAITSRYARGYPRHRVEGPAGLAAS